MNGAEEAKLCLPNQRFRRHRNTFVLKVDDTHDGYRCEDCGYEELVVPEQVAPPPAEPPP